MQDTLPVAEERLFELIQNKCFSSWRVAGGWGGETPSFSICMERITSFEAEISSVTFEGRYGQLALLEGSPAEIRK